MASLMASGKLATGYVTRNPAIPAATPCGFLSERLWSSASFSGRFSTPPCSEEYANGHERKPPHRPSFLSARWSPCGSVATQGRPFVDPSHQSACWRGRISPVVPSRLGHLAGHDGLQAGSLPPVDFHACNQLSPGR